MGWALLAILAASAIAASWLLGAPRMLLTTIAAALTLGATGYALQGSPALPGATVAGAAGQRPMAIDPDTIALRDAMLGRFTFAHDYFVLSDAMLRAGAPEAAATYMLSGINKARDNYALWMGLGTALSERDGQTLSPAASFAFARAMQLAPEQPAPPFFVGLALIRAGDFAAARPMWARALMLAPAGREYRPQIAARLAELDQLLAMLEGMPPG
ncbi:tetratricopeptide repeat protein [Sphingomonas japonica]|uniref:Tetratricopeptide (TPR) repeat protein n=1 Tax=Sphingomonas japonica TaxID=511662 RepID=A0ABX0U4R4_9SPHN|nr:hypothetical protein [Sphingomonas japonica]NIJ25045.1 tetratricopeptide (TPR) repeat protein [Sphingomonas japonica]